MSERPFHEDEVATSPALVQALLRAQLPQWAGLPVAEAQAHGTTNAVFRVGEDLSVRLPRTAGAVQQIEKDDRWLPKLAPHLPLEIPVPLATGVPGEGYPLAWTVHPWIEGRAAELDTLDDPIHAAETVAAFCRALQAVDASEGLSAGDLVGGRGAPLATRDAQVRSCADALGTQIDRQAVLASWEASLAAPAYEGPGVWVHGDLAPSNLLERDGRIVAVIDFGCLGIGDPSCELLIAWNFFRGPSRAALRSALRVDDAMWLRGRGWALSWALICLPYYLGTRATSVPLAWQVIEEVLADG